LCRRIAAAIKEAGLEGRAHPLDYLQFFCLAKRESNEQYWDKVRALNLLGVPLVVLILDTNQLQLQLGVAAQPVCPYGAYRAMQVVYWWWSLFRVCRAMVPTAHTVLTRTGSHPTRLLVCC
jgi:hypothetical protein